MEWSRLSRDLVAHGFKQHVEIDFSYNFAFTVSGSGIRLLSQNACECNFDFLSHCDVDQAFVQSNPEEEGVFSR